MDDREVVAAIAAGDRAGIAAAYDKFAAGLYGYCQWMLGGSDAAAEALRDTFAAATTGDLPEGPELRPWLFAVAGSECRRRLDTAAPAYAEDAGTADQPPYATAPPVDGADEPSDATLMFPVVRPLADAAEAADATLQFPAVRDLAEATRPGDATKSTRAFWSLKAAAQPSDATLQFPALKPAADATQPIRAVRRLASLAGRLTGASGDRRQADLQAPIRAALAGLEPDEREAIELSLRYELYDSDLATVLGVSWSQAHALTSRARSHLEADLGPLLVARTGREDCPVLGTLLADWDGQLTEQTRRLVGEHTGQCEICVGRRRATLRLAVLAGLPPLAVLPAGLRDDVLKHCFPAAADTPQSQPSGSSARFVRWSAAVRAIRWDSIRSHPGAATATTAVILWVVAAVSVAALTLAGSHSARALGTRPSVSALPTTPAARTPPATASPTTPAARHTSVAARSSPAASQPYLAPTARSFTTTASAVPPSRSASPSPSRSPKPSKSPSASPSRSPSPSVSPSRSASPSPSPAA